MNKTGDTAKYVTRTSIPADHPSLPGHFPGRPIVPGVVLLGHVLDLAQSLFSDDLQIRGIEQAKFLAPLLPDQEVQVTLSQQATHLRFTIERDTDVIATGSFLLANGSP